LQTGRSSSILKNGRLFVAIRDAGRGPALFVRVELDADGNSPDVWNLGALAPGDEQQLVFSGVSEFRAAKQVLIDYRDLSGRVLEVDAAVPRTAEYYARHGFVVENPAVQCRMARSHHHAAPADTSAGMRDDDLDERKQPMETAAQLQ
jgi:hypothetical protein